MTNSFDGSFLSDVNNCVGLVRYYCDDTIKLENVPYDILPLEPEELKFRQNVKFKGVLVSYNNHVGIGNKINKTEVMDILADIELFHALEEKLFKHKDVDSDSIRFENKSISMCDEEIEYVLQFNFKKSPEKMDV
jgi:hypothetical protein